MSDTEKRDAVVEEFCPQRYRESPWQTIRKLAAEDMADEIVRLRGVLAARRAEIDRLRDQLRLADQSARSSRAEAERIRAEIERILTEARAEINHLCQRAERAERILDKLREPSESIMHTAYLASFQHTLFDRAWTATLCAAVAAAEREVDHA